MAMYRTLFQSYMKQEPKNVKEKYIFITDNKELANAMFALGFKVLLLSRDEENEYTAESFIQYMREIEFKGTFRSDYIYALVCFYSQTREILKAYFKAEYLTYREDAWLPFKNKKYLAKLEYQEELKETLDNYIKRYEGGSDEQKRSVTTENGIIKPVEEIAPLSYIRANDLDVMQIEKPFFVVEKILPTGLCVLASPPKYGKSWYSLDLCISVATGTKFLGFATNKSDVLYLALEDSNARLQERMRKVLNGRKAPQGLGYAINAGTLQHGLIEQLENYLEENPHVKLIVIDTFQKIRSETKKGQSAYAADYTDCGQLKTFADSKKICLLIVHHMRKMRDISDTFANISGTAGISGAADTMMTMNRENRDDENTKLSITGRDVEMQEFQIQFNKEKCRWHMLGASDEVEELKAIEEYNNSPIVLTVKKLLNQNKIGWTGSATEIVNASRMFKVPIFDSAQKVGQAIGKYQELLFQQDNIMYEPVKNGSGAKKHRFFYGYNPFENNTV